MTSKKKKIDIIDKNNDNEEIKNILIVGKRGSGKSTLANVLSKTKKFSTTSDTNKLIRSQKFSFNKQKYKVIDIFGLTNAINIDSYEIGIDSEISEINKVFEEGFCQVLFVVDGEIGREEEDIYHFLHKIILKEKTKDMLTIVRTKFEEFENKESVQKDLKVLKEQPIPNEIISNSRGIIYVDNPSFRYSRRNSIKKLTNELRASSRNLILSEIEKSNNQNLEGVEKIGEEIVSYKSRLKEILPEKFSWHSENEKLKEKVFELEEKLNKTLEEQNNEEAKFARINFVMKEAQLAQARKKIEELNVRVRFLAAKKINLENEIIEKNDKISHLNNLKLKAEQEVMHQNLHQQNDCIIS